MGRRVLKICAGYLVAIAVVTLLVGMQDVGHTMPSLKDSLAAAPVIFVVSLPGYAALRTLAAAFGWVNFPVAILFGGVNGILVMTVATWGGIGPSAAMLVSAFAIGAVGGATVLIVERWFNTRMAMGRTE